MQLVFSTCAVCGKLYSADRLTVFEGDCFCPSCLKAETVICSCCGERIWRDDVLGDSLTPLCEYCEEYHYSHCAGCGRLVKADELHYPSEDTSGYCENCYTKHI